MVAPPSSTWTTMAADASTLGEIFLNDTTRYSTRPQSRGMTRAIVHHDEERRDDDDAVPPGPHDLHLDDGQGSIAWSRSTSYSRPSPHAGHFD